MRQHIIRSQCVNIIFESRSTLSAPVMDDVEYETLQKLPIKYKLLVVDIYNKIYIILYMIMICGSEKKGSIDNQKSHKSDACIDESIRNKKDVLAVFLDIRNAFDNVDINFL